MLRTTCKPQMNLPVINLIDPSTAPALAGAPAQDFAPRAYWKVPRACPWGSTVNTIPSGR